MSASPVLRQCSIGFGKIKYFIIIEPLIALYILQVEKEEGFFLRAYQETRYKTPKFRLLCSRFKKNIISAKKQLTREEAKYVNFFFSRLLNTGSYRYIKSTPMNC
jgi:hypothetical protein